MFVTSFSRQERTQEKRKLRQADSSTTNEKNRIYRRKKKANMTQKERFIAFKRDIIHGPNFTCFSCKRCQFKNSVKILGEDEIAKLWAKLDVSFRRQISFRKKVMGNKLISCHNCLRQIKKNKLPKIHVSNGLKLDKVPEELKLTDLEQQLIGKETF